MPDMSAVASGRFERLLTCTACGLHRTRRMIAGAVGPLDAEIAFYGEAPGHEEDRIGVPFRMQSETAHVLAHMASR